MAVTHAAETIMSFVLQAFYAISLRAHHIGSHHLVNAEVTKHVCGHNAVFALR